MLTIDIKNVKVKSNNLSNVDIKIQTENTIGKN